MKKKSPAYRHFYERVHFRQRNHRFSKSWMYISVSKKKSYYSTGKILCFFKSSHLWLYKMHTFNSVLKKLFYLYTKMC